MQPGGGADAGQRLAAEAEGGDPHQGGVVELGGAVPLHGEREVVGGHAVPVIDHLDAVDAAALEADRDAGGAGVERVLDQFLDHGGRPLDHLAGGDAVDQAFREQADSRHGSVYRGQGAGARRGDRPSVNGEQALDHRSLITGHRSLIPATLAHG